MALEIDGLEDIVSQSHGSSFGVAKTASFVLLSYIIYNAVYNLYLSPLARFPGPKLWAISDIPRQISIVRGRAHLRILALHNHYGPVVRVGPHELSFNTPQAFQDIYGFRRGEKETHFPKDPKLYATQLSGMSTAVGGYTDNETHTRQRRLLSHAFSERSLREQEGTIVHYVDLLMQRLRERTNLERTHKAEVDLARWFNFTTFDIIGDLMFAEPFDCLKSNQLHPWIHLIFSSLKAFTLLNVINQYTLVRKFQENLLPKSLIRQLLSHLDLCKQKADRRLEAGTSRPDFISAILKHGLGDEEGRFIEDQPIMSRSEIYANSAFFTIAGSETTATMLAGCVYYLCKHREIKDKLCDEIRSAFSSDQEIRSSKCTPLVYLNAVLEESLRMYPPVAAGDPRLVPQGGSTVGGHVLPEYTTVYAHRYSAHHAAENFALPEQFIPERWMGNDCRFDSDKRDAVQPFSLGPRNCLGKNLAHLEMRLILCKLLFNFNIELAPGSENWIDQEVFIIWNRPALSVQLTDRFA
ncbi:cytochrome P450 [Aspergillus alliaceus]|uniref:Cytochrome P450 n=1 Tax=Petromyces alliaceus TaxID=209559 RepID=A0A5N7CFG0_PETAA|nr:cytochrome P450 [Aspergillus alliaceus]